MKDHEIIATIEKAIDSATAAQRASVEAWLRSRLADKAEAKPVESESTKALRELLEKLPHDPPLPAPLTQPFPFNPWWQEPIYRRNDLDWWHLQPGTICGGPVLSMSISGNTVTTDKAIHGSGPVASVGSAIHAGSLTGSLRLAS